MEDQTVYFEVNIKGLPKTQNQLIRKHYRVVTAEKNHWKYEVFVHCHKYIPEEPLSKAKVICTRHSSVEPDYDGLVSSFKYVIDALVAHGFVIDDSSKYLEREYEWKKEKRGHGFIKIEFEGKNI